jgi:HAE1 family hydrophobic/amphiphilic exporter-1
MIRFFMGHPTAANLLMLFFIVLGISAIPQLKRETFPDFKAEEVEILIRYPGASAQEVEEALCQRIEEALDGLNFVEEIRSEAQEGLARVVVKMQEKGRFDSFLDDIKNEVEAIDTFPESAELPRIQALNKTDHVASLALTGSENPIELKAYAESLKEELLQLKEISQVEILGFSDSHLRIELQQEILQRHRLDLAEVAQRIRQQSFDLPLGTLETNDKDILIRFQEQRRRPKELENLVLYATPEGAEIRLGELAKIRYSFEKEEIKIRFNGKRCALLKVTKTKGEDTIRVGNALKAFVDTQRKILPFGVELKLTQDVFSMVQDRLDLLIQNGWQGFILVALTLWLFFNRYFAFWVVMGLPASFLGAFFFMPFLGQSINMLTMVGFLIALGLLMDDSIVIAENIATHFSLRKTPLEAARDGTEEVFVGVLSSYLTTVCMFGPLIFLQGDIGKVLRVMPVVLILTLTVSLVEAFLILPNHLSHSLKAESSPNLLRRFFDALIHRVQKQVGHFARLIIRWRYLFIGTIFGLFLTAIGLLAGGIVKFSAFPPLEGNTLEVRILLPQGTPLSRTEAIVDKLEKALKDVEGLFPHPEPLVLHTLVEFNKNVDAFENGPHLATLSADFLASEKRTVRLDDILKAWKTQVGALPDVVSLNFIEPTLGPQGRAIEIRLQGDSLDTLKSASLELQQWLQQYQGILFLSDDLRPGKPEIRYRLREGALMLGVSGDQIAQQLRTAFYGATLTEIQQEKDSYKLDIRLSLSDKDSLADLEDFRIRTSQGEQIPLDTLTTKEYERGYARIQRINRQKTVVVLGDVDPRILNVAEMMKETQQHYFPQLRKKYPTLSLHLEGEMRKGEETAQSARKCFLFGVIGIFMILSFQFRSYLEPFVVLTAIPLSLIGVIGGHYLMGLNMTMPSMVGFISLSGVVVNDSLLLVIFLKSHAQQGESVYVASALASEERFRAVLLTSLTTIAGLVPLLFETSIQAQVLIPLAASLVFGLSASTLLVLFVVPALYSIFEDWGLTASLKQRDKEYHTGDTEETLHAGSLQIPPSNKNQY